MPQDYGLFLLPQTNMSALWEVAQSVGKVPGALRLSFPVASSFLSFTVILIDMIPEQTWEASCNVGSEVAASVIAKQSAKQRLKCKNLLEISQ